MGKMKYKAFFEKYVYLLWALFLASFVLHRIATSYSSIILALAYGAYYFAYPESLRQIEWRKYLPFFVFFLVALYTAVDMHAFSVSKELGLKIPFLVMPIFILTRRFREHEKVFMMKAMIYSLLFFLIIMDGYGLYRSIHFNDQKFLIYNFLVEFSGQSPIYISLYVLIGLIFLNWIQFYASKQATFSMPVFYGINIFYSLNLILLFSRLYYLLFALLFLVWFVLAFRKKYISYTFLMVMFASLIFTVYVLYKNYFFHYRFSNYLQYGDMSNYKKPEDRYYIWNCAKILIAEKPFTGYGMGKTRDHLILCYANTQYQNGVVNRFNAHSQYFESILEMGFPLFLLLAFLVLISISKAINRKNHLYLLVLGCMSFLFITESYLKVQSSSYLFCFVICFTFFQHNKIEEEV